MGISLSCCEKDNEDFVFNGQRGAIQNKLKENYKLKTTQIDSGNETSTRSTPKRADEDNANYKMYPMKSELQRSIKIEQKDIVPILSDLEGLDSKPNSFQLEPIACADMSQEAQEEKSIKIELVDDETLDEYELNVKTMSLESKKNK